MMRAQDVSQDNPAVLRRTTDDAEVRVTDPAEYQTLVYTSGYKDVTADQDSARSAQHRAPAAPAQSRPASSGGGTAGPAAGQTSGEAS